MNCHCLYPPIKRLPHWTIELKGGVQWLSVATIAPCVLPQAAACKWHIKPDATAVIQPVHPAWHALQRLLQPVSQDCHSLAAGLLDWPQLAQLLSAGCWLSYGSMSVLCGSEHALLPAKYESYDRIISQVGVCCIPCVLFLVVKQSGVLMWSGVLTYVLTSSTNA